MTERGTVYLMDSSHVPWGLPCSPGNIDLDIALHGTVITDIKRYDSSYSCMGRVSQNEINYSTIRTAGSFTSGFSNDVLEAIGGTEVTEIVMLGTRLFWVHVDVEVTNHCNGGRLQLGTQDHRF